MHVSIIGRDLPKFSLSDKDKFNPEFLRVFLLIHFFLCPLFYLIITLQGKEGLRGPAGF